MSRTHAFGSLLFTFVALPLAASAADPVVPVQDSGTTPLNAPEHTLNAADREAFRQDDLGLTVIRMANGTEMVDLQGRYQMAATAAADAEGSMHMGCTTEHDIAEHGIATPAPKSKPEER